jgi:uncharacterized protein YqjF (DUF2071 family)
MTSPNAAARLEARIPNGRRPQVMHHRWESLLFLHWQLPAARIQETLPAGLTVDTFDGAAFVAIAPFFMRDVRPIGVPALPWISQFQELNVRTYVYDRNGIPGVWFYSLDCNQPLAVVAARALTGLTYCHATMSATRAEWIDYSSRRADTTQTAQYRYRGVGVAREPDPDSLESFLLDRYYLFAMRGGSLVRGQVSHERYRPRGAEVEQFSAVPAHLDGFADLTGAPMHQCYVDGFDVKVYATEKVA